MKTRINVLFITAILLLLPLNLYTASRQKAALLIGISNYRVIDNNTEWDNIHGKNDIELIAPLLQKQGFRVKKLSDKDATKREIVKGIKALIKQTKKGAIVYLHFSCHGQPFEDFNGDETDGWDESIVPVDAKISYQKGKYEGQNHLVDDELHRYVEQLRSRIGIAGRLYVVIDACHAGRSSRGEGSMFTRGTNRGFSPSGKIYHARREKANRYDLPAINGKAPITYLEACRNTQVNTEVKRNGKFYGPMSYYIATVLKQYSIGTDDQWVFRVQTLMRKDINVQNQDMVIESSKKL